MQFPTFSKFADQKKVHQANIDREAHWVTVGSLPVTTGPHLADYVQTRKVSNANNNGHKRTDPNLRENVVRFCKTFIHRFDSDRRLQLLKYVNNLRIPTKSAIFGWVTGGSVFLMHKFVRLLKTSNKMCADSLRMAR